MNNQTNSFDILVGIIRNLAQKKRDTLEELKKEYSQIRRPDFIWHFLLQSASTLGRASGYDGLIANKNNYEKVTFDALLKLSPQQRLETLEETLRNANVRYHIRKAQQLNDNFNKILDMGGLEAVKKKLFDSRGKQAKMKFLMSFSGIGDKYARNIMMDVYHEEFRESIALDKRILAISQNLGLNFKTYDEYESFYLKVANAAGLNGWEVDRLMFNFKNELISEIQTKFHTKRAIFSEIDQSQFSITAIAKPIKKKSGIYSQIKYLESTKAKNTNLIALVVIIVIVLFISLLKYIVQY